MHQSENCVNYMFKVLDMGKMSERGVVVAAASIQGCCCLIEDLFGVCK